MLDDDEVMRKICASLNLKLGKVLRAMQEMNVHAEAQITSKRSMFIIASKIKGDIEGEINLPCDHCQSTVWIAPSSQETIKRRDKLPTKIVCFDCLKTLMKENVDA